MIVGGFFYFFFLFFDIYIEESNSVPGIFGGV